MSRKQKYKEYAVEKWLKNYTNISREIAARENEILRYETMLTRCVPVYDGIHTKGGEGLDREKFYDVIVAEKRAVERLTVRKAEAERFIAGLTDERHRTVLLMRYVQGVGWQNISELMGYSPDYLKGKLKWDALDAAEKLYKLKNI
jgi:hypothetical protein